MHIIKYSAPVSTGRRRRRGGGREGPGHSPSSRERRKNERVAQRVGLERGERRRIRAEDFERGIYAFDRSARDSSEIFRINIVEILIASGTGVVSREGNLE